MTSDNADTAYDLGPGMLTDSQRDYLEGLSDIDPKSAHERTIRSRIRERIINGINDLGLVAREVEPRDLEKVVSDDPFTWDFSVSGGALLEVALRNESLFPTGNGEEDDVTEYLEGLLSSAIEGIYVDDGREVKECVVNIDLTLGRDTSEIDDELKSLSADEVWLLFASGEISKSELGDEIIRRREEEGEDLLG